MFKLMIKLLFACLLLFHNSIVMADDTITINISKTTGDKKSIGFVVAKDTPYGLLITPHLSDLTPGLHGFHIHENASCEETGMAAGGHLDPDKTKQHLGPYVSTSHLGDLPALYVDNNGNASLPVLAPRLKVKMIHGRSLMIHAGGDNYSDTPQKLGGGGDRIACGSIH